MFLWLCLPFVAPSVAIAADRYADNATTGGCSNGSTTYNPTTRSCGSGTSTVYTTIENAYSGLAAGDTIWIRGGGATYTGTAENSRVNITGVRGTSGNTVKLFGYPGDTTPVIHGFHNNLGCSPGCQDWHHYKDFIIDPAGQFDSVGFHCNSGCERITWENLEIRNAGAQGMCCVTGNNSQWINLWVHDNGVNGSASAGQRHGLYIVNGTGHIIRGGRMNNNSAYGIHASHSAGGHANSCLNMTIEGVRADNNGTVGIGCFGSLATTSTIRNVIADNNGSNGVWLGATGTISNVSAYNNGGVGVCVTDGTQTINNILSLGNGTNFGSTTGTCGGGTTNGNPTTNTSITSGTATNFWVDPVNADFNLLSTAATAINAGTTVTGHAINGTGSDIGAFETASVVSPNGCFTVDSSNVDCQLQNAYAPFTKISAGTTGFTLTQSGVDQTLTSVSVVNNSTLRYTCSACLSAGTTITASKSSSAVVRDSSNIGQSTNTYTAGDQILFDWSGVSVANTLSGGSSSVWTTAHYRCRTWNHNLTSNTQTDWYRSEDTTCSVQNSSGKIAIVAAITCTGADCIATGFDWEFQTNGGPGWTDVDNSCATNNVCYDNTQVGGAIHGASITSALLTNPFGTYVTGWVQGQDSSFSPIDLSQDSTTNIMGSFAIKNGLTAGSTTISVRPKRDNGTSISHTVTPTFEVVNPGAGLQ